MATPKPSILVPYDATELSIKALDKAVEIATNMDYTILLLYIIDAVVVDMNDVSVDYSQ